LPSGGLEVEVDFDTPAVRRRILLSRDRGGRTNAKRLPV
jgi:hypothetical protein